MSNCVDIRDKSALACPNDECRITEKHRHSIFIGRDTRKA
jgi:hypothetical protein